MLQPAAAQQRREARLGGWRGARPGGRGGLSSGSPAADGAPWEKWPGPPCTAPPGKGPGRPAGDPSLPEGEGRGTGGRGWGPVSPCGGSDAGWRQGPDSRRRALGRGGQMPLACPGKGCESPGEEAIGKGRFAWL